MLLIEFSWLRITSREAQETYRRNDLTALLEGCSAWSGTGAGCRTAQHECPHCSTFFGENGRCRVPNRALFRTFLARLALFQSQASDRLYGFFAQKAISAVCVRRRNTIDSGSRRESQLLYPTASEASRVRGHRNPLLNINLLSHLRECAKLGPRPSMQPCPSGS
jgi:hypothetical protein